MPDGVPADSIQSIRFRKAGPGDVGVLADLNQALIRDEQHRNSMSLVELEERMAEFMSTDYEAMLFESEENVVGYALYRGEEEYLYLRQFYIREEYRRLGIGRSAVVWLQQNALENRARMRLDVLTANSAAQAFWRAVGFRDYCVTMERECDDDAQ